MTIFVVLSLMLLSLYLGHHVYKLENKLALSRDTLTSIGIENAMLKRKLQALQRSKDNLILDAMKERRA